ncbi:hypothetical protein TNCV_4064891 [Trichonephila clavipes]|nr:hypothetical protein TNCV_4064891 [Trichonephila clavipes]
MVSVTENHCPRRHFDLRPCRKKNLKIKANAGEKQLNSSVGTKQLNPGSRNETTQLPAGMKQLNSAAGMKQLNSSVGTKTTNSALPSTAYNRLQPPTNACNCLYNRLINRLQPLQPPRRTACTAFTAESAFLPTII